MIGTTGSEYEPVKSEEQAEQTGLRDLMVDKYGGTPQTQVLLFTAKTRAYVQHLLQYKISVLFRYRYKLWQSV